MKQFCFGLACLLWGSMVVVHASENHVAAEAFGALNNGELFAAHNDERKLAPIGWCAQSDVIDFDKAGNGRDLTVGQYVMNEWKSRYGVTVTARGDGGGFTPGNKPRLFDSANPGSFKELGSPNNKCANAGPGIGRGGIPGSPGENCEPQKLVLIIQDKDTTYCKDFPGGGVITFRFDQPTDVTSINLLDINADGKVDVFMTNGGRFTTDVPALGDNSAQEVGIFQEEVLRIDVHFAKHGAISKLSFCPPDRPDTPRPTPNPVARPTPRPTRNPVPRPTRNPVPRPTRNPTARPTSCNPSRTIISENFENGSLAGWTNGHLAQSPGFSKFLGRYGMDNSGPGKDPFKVYRNIPRDADHVVLEVDFYEIDSWNGKTQKDYACIQINDQRTDLGRFDETVNENGRQARRGNGLNYRIVSRSGPRQIGFSRSKDQIHRVFVTIPRRYYQSTGTLKVMFMVRLTANRDDESGGWDNIKLIARYNCGGNRWLRSREAPELALQEIEEIVDCVEASKTTDVSALPTAKCTAGDHVDPIDIVYQDGDSVTFTVSQLWRGCDAEDEKAIDWVATDFVGLDGELQCSLSPQVGCGQAALYTALCEDGVAVVDVYAHDSSGGSFLSPDQSVSVPSVCGATEGDATNTCHFRYLLKCLPSLCDSVQHEAMGLEG